MQQLRQGYNELNTLVLDYARATHWVHVQRGKMREILMSEVAGDVPFSSFSVGRRPRKCNDRGVCLLHQVPVGRKFFGVLSIYGVPLRPVERSRSEMEGTEHWISTDLE